MNESQLDVAIADRLLARLFRSRKLLGASVPLLVQATRRHGMPAAVRGDRTKRVAGVRHPDGTERAEFDVLPPRERRRLLVAQPGEAGDLLGRLLTPPEVVPS